jgi:hypothetical protein
MSASTFPMGRLRTMAAISRALGTGASSAASSVGSGGNHGDFLGSAVVRGSRRGALAGGRGVKRHAAEASYSRGSTIVSNVRSTSGSGNAPAPMTCGVRITRSIPGWSNSRASRSATSSATPASA